MVLRYFHGIACAIVIALALLPANAQELTFFRIGTGGTTGTYYPIGGLIANAVSVPPGSRACSEGGSCGVAGLLISTVSTNGSVANVVAIQDGTLESGFVQSDIATWAETGTGIWQDRPRADKLRAIANLYPESIHLVASGESGIRAIADLRGKRVSLDEPGSGTLVDAKIILESAEMTEADIQPEYLRADRAANALHEGTLDAFFFVGGYPAGVVAELAGKMDIVLVPIDGETAASITATYPFFAVDSIPGGTYQGISGDTGTISVGAQWITSADQPEDLIHDITNALWNDGTRRQLDAGHAKGSVVSRETALDGIGIPLHPGARRFYQEAGLLP